MPWMRRMRFLGILPFGNHVAHARACCPCTSFIGPIFSSCSNCLRKSSSVKIALGQLLLLLLQLFLARSLLDPLHLLDDQAMMSPWPRIRWAMPFGPKFLQPIELLADADELDRDLGDFLDGQGRTAAGVAVHLGQDDAVEFQGIVERLGAVDGVLAGHGVADQVDLVGLDHAVDLLQLVHRHLGDVQPAGGVEDDGVEQVVAWRSRRRYGRRRPAWPAALSL